jgi:hypothetical protein
MNKTLITDGFDGEDEPDEASLYSEYRDRHNKEMTDIAKVLDRARIVYRIKEK